MVLSAASLACIVTCMSSGTYRLPMIVRVISPFDSTLLTFTPINFVLGLDIGRTRLYVESLRLDHYTWNNYVDINGCGNASACSEHQGCACDQACSNGQIFFD